MKLTERLLNIKDSAQAEIITIGTIVKGVVTNNVMKELHNETLAETKHVLASKRAVNKMDKDIKKILKENEELEKLRV